MKFARLLLSLVILLAALACSWDVRAFSPYPTNYLSRLRFLQGWSSRGFYAFNCSGFISNAHGSRYYSEREMFAGTPDLKIRLVLPSRWALDESKLKPGDVAAFAGPSGGGQHVAAYLGNGTWIDGDNRRGFVSSYRLGDRSAIDPWFMGEVHILEWVAPPTDLSLSARLGFFSLEQQAIAR